MRHRWNHTPPDSAKLDLLTTAFKRMRHEGLLARQRFLCCSGCAGYAMAERAEKLVDQGKRDKIKGCVFYHRQDADTLDEIGEVYLAYGELATTRHGKIGLPTAEVGQMVTRILGEVGLAYEWDGNPGTRILVNCRTAKAATDEGKAS
jgi:hypothetical protein